MLQKQPLYRPAPSGQEELGEEQIKNPSPETEYRIFVLEHLIPVLEKASTYQNAMIRHLNDSASSDPETATVKNSYRLNSALAIRAF